MSHTHIKPYCRQRGKSHLNDSQSLEIIKDPQQSTSVMASLQYRTLSGAHKSRVLGKGRRKWKHFSYLWFSPTITRFFLFQAHGRTALPGQLGESMRLLPAVSVRGSPVCRLQDKAFKLNVRPPRSPSFSLPWPPLWCTQQREWLNDEVYSTVSLPNKALGSRTWTRKSRVPRTPAMDIYYETTESPLLSVTKTCELFDTEHNNPDHPYSTGNNNESSYHHLKEWKEAIGSRKR